PALDHSSHSEDKLGWSAARAVKLRSVREGARIVNRHCLTRTWRRTSAFNQVNVLKTRSSGNLSAGTATTFGKDISNRGSREDNHDDDRDDSHVAVLAGWRARAAGGIRALRTFFGLIDFAMTALRQVFDSPCVV